MRQYRRGRHHYLHKGSLAARKVTLTFYADLHAFLSHRMPEVLQERTHSDRNDWVILQNHAQNNQDKLFFSTQRQQVSSVSANSLFVFAFAAEKERPDTGGTLLAIPTSDKCAGSQVHTWLKSLLVDNVIAVIVVVWLIPSLIEGPLPLLVR